MIFNSGDGRLRRVSAFVTPDSPPGPARSFILHGCRSHVAGARREIGRVVPGTGSYLPTHPSSMNAATCRMNGDGASAGGIGDH